MTATLATPASPSESSLRRPEIVPPGRFERLGRWSARRRWWVLTAWLVILVAATLGSSAAGGSFNAVFTITGSSAQTGADLLQQHSGGAPAGTSAQAGQIVLHVPTGTLADHHAAVAAAERNIARVAGVATAAAPVTSPDGRVVIESVTYRGAMTSLGTTDVAAMDRAVAPARSAGVLVDYGADLGSATRASSQIADLVGIGAALVVLLLVFGSVLATILPVLGAVIGVLAGIGVLGLAAAGLQFPSEAPTIAIMLGLGVGIDYGLFLCTRFRQLLLDGDDPITAAGRAMNSSGRAVLVAAGTVVVAILGLWASGLFYVGQLGTAVAITVAVAAAAALTLVPALLAIAGRRIDRLKVRRTPIAEPRQPNGLWYRYAGAVTRRPVVALGSGLLLLVLLGAPLLTMRLGNPGVSAQSTASTERRASDAIASGYGVGYESPIAVVVQEPAGTPPSSLAARATAWQQRLVDQAGVRTATPFVPTADHALLVGQAIATTAPDAVATGDLVRRLTTTALQRAAAPGETVYVTGKTASSIALTDRISQTLPPVIAVVVAAAMLLILLTFRSPVLALKAGLINLLSIGASYGVLVAVFQWGWGSGLLGIPQPVSIVSFVPMLMFAIVFGLSMDYEVFLLARIREARLAGGTEAGSIATGIAGTGRIISCAAVIMACVFASFLLTSSVTVQMLALGLALSVLIDATIVRLLLVPATMVLLGRANWWTPRWLDRVLPHLEP